jgi:segregation and condensation protein B
MSATHLKNVIEAALLAAGRPLEASELVELFEEPARPSTAEVRAAIEELTREYAGRGIELALIAGGYRIQVRRELAAEVSRLFPERPPRYSRALLEILALIAYRQPITRGEIEAVRGVAVNPAIVKTLLERNWVRVVGQRDVPGHPELLGTTREFLDYFGLRSLDELPPLAELKAMGEINLQLELAGSSAAAAVEPTAESVTPAAATAASPPEGSPRGAPLGLDEAAEDDAAEDESERSEAQNPGGRVAVSAEPGG